MIVRKIVNYNTLLNVEEIIDLIGINAERFERSDDSKTRNSLNDELFGLYDQLYDFSLVLVSELEYFLEVEKDEEEEEEIINEEEEN